MNQILVVDDDLELRENITEILDGAGFSPQAAACAQDGIELAKQGQFEIILLDFMMPGMNGIEAIPEFQRVSPHSKIIMLTAFATVENAVNAIKKGASEYISKPFKIDQLLTLIRQMLEELRFDVGIKKLEMEETLSSLSNSIRRKTIRLFQSRKSIRMMEITRELGIEDHTKVAFHLRILKEAGILGQNKDKSYHLTKEGEKIHECLHILENYLADN
ncbi:MAG: hypothetical protein COB67_08805 [SAR324 cluster bacterium]|uniref:Response regulatory domain-containing protein n=1 Tax=SAR324 cluster bacterium TaxID=2024889 RepID=A0A2A4T1Y6_9DELT|nr:MAG: hypothetical protein COB67_08805 [SAR324 cluster bacterium]